MFILPVIKIPIGEQIFRFMIFLCNLHPDYGWIKIILKMKKAILLLCASIFLQFSCAQKPADRNLYKEDIEALYEMKEKNGGCPMIKWEFNFDDPEQPVVSNYREGTLFQQIFFEETDGVKRVTAICVPGGQAKDFSNIGKFTALTKLDCAFCDLVELDVSKNTKLKELNCHKNLLTKLDISHNKELVNLWCSYNQLSSLDVSKNPKLEKLYCYENQLTTLDVGENKELGVLDCHQNQMTALDVSINLKLRYLEIEDNPFEAKQVKIKDKKYTYISPSEDSGIYEVIP